MQQLEVTLRELFKQYPSATYHISIVEGFYFNPKTREITDQVVLDGQNSFYGRLTGSFEGDSVGVVPCGGTTEIKVDYSKTLGWFRNRE